MFMKEQSKSLCLWLCVFFHFFICGSLHAATPKPFSTPPPNPTIKGELIRSNIIISQWFDGAAEGLDLFLVGKEATVQKNETMVRVENSTYLSEGDGVSNASTLDVKLRLPNVEKYWQLKFTSYDEQEESRGVSRYYLRTRPRERNYGTTIGFIRKLSNIRIAFQPRIEFQRDLKVSHSLSFESVAASKYYEINPKLEFYANPTKGTGVFGALNLHRSLTKIYSITLLNDAEYQEKQHLYLVTNGLSFGQWLSDISTLSYTVLFNSNNQEAYNLDSYNFSVSYSRVLYKRMLDFLLTPHWDFTRKQGYKGDVGLTTTFYFNF
jgi:hypothetical protein